jgi:hypothetical protein
VKGKPGTRARIPLGSRAIIMARAVETPRISRKELAKKLQNELQEKGFDVPEIEVLERMISEYRNKIINGPEDEPWSLLTLTNFDIAAEALPIVFDLWAYALREYQKPLTIREMKWAARLYRIIENNIEELLISSIRYAAYERAQGSLGDKFASIANEVGFQTDIELYADFRLHMTLTTDELLKVPEDPEILKRKRQSFLQKLRSPGILEEVGFDTKFKQKRGKGNERVNKAKR